MEFSGILPTSYQPNVFSCASTEHENVMNIVKKTELLDIFVTEYPRLTTEDIAQTQFAFSYFEQDRTDFLKYQDTIQYLSRNLFGDTAPLGDFEQSVLNETFQRALKNTPTRPNRL